jgi:hypothetical protein
MRILLLSLVWLLLGVVTTVASAQISSPAPQPNAGSGGKPARSFVLRNLSGGPITQAQVVTTDGQTVDLLRGLGPLTAAEGRNVLVPGGACIRDVHITLQNGKQLALNGRNDCDQSIIEVDPNSVRVSGSAAGR